MIAKEFDPLIMPPRRFFFLLPLGWLRAFKHSLPLAFGLALSNRAIEHSLYFRTGDRLYKRLIQLIRLFHTRDSWNNRLQTEVTRRMSRMEWDDFKDPTTLGE